MIAQIPVLIVVIPLISSFFCPLIGLWRKEGCYFWTVFSLSLCALASLDTLFTVIESGTIHYRLGGWAPPWGIEYVVDHLNALMLVLVSFISLMVAINSKKSVEQELPERIGFFYTVFLLQVTGLLGIVITGDMFNLYVFLEVASLAGYALIAIGEDGAPLASFRYIVMGTIGACFYLLGVGYVYMATGSLNMAELSQILPASYHSKVVLVAFAFFMVGLALKIALFPLHTWLPDAYTRAPSAVSSLIAPTVTKVGAYVMIRIMYTVFKPYFYIESIPITTILSWIAAGAMIIGSIFAIIQSDLKRMLAYSSVAQIGYIVLGIGLANKAGLTGAILHIVNHAFMKGGLFLVAGAIVYKMGVRDIYQFKNLYRRMPFTMTTFTIAAFSMIGIPPTCGFFSKLYLILGSIDAKQWTFVAVILISSILNAIYFLKVIEIAYFQPQESANPNPNSRGSHGAAVAMDEVPLSMLIPILIMGAGIILLGIFNGQIITNVIQFAIPTIF